jgi:hypothetical protein
VQYCSAVNSGTSALHQALLAAGVGTGDEVITASMTFADVFRGSGAGDAIFVAKYAIWLGLRLPLPAITHDGPSRGLSSFC